MKEKPEILYTLVPESQESYCPICHQDRLAFITRQGIKLSYSKLRKHDNKTNSIFNQLDFKRVECLNCGSRFLINWITEPISIVYVRRKNQ